MLTTTAPAADLSAEPRLGAIKLGAHSVSFAVPVGPGEENGCAVALRWVS